MFITSNVKELEKVGDILVYYNNEKNKFTKKDYAKIVPDFVVKNNKVKRIATSTLRCIGYALGSVLFLFSIWLLMLVGYACM